MLKLYIQNIIFCGKKLSTHILSEALKSSENNVAVLPHPQLAACSHEDYNTLQFVFPKLYSICFN